MTDKPQCWRCGRRIPKRREGTHFCTDRCAREQQHADEESARSEREYQESHPPEAGPNRGRDWRTMSIVELAAENQSVMEYVKHWEDRCLKAERARDEAEAWLINERREYPNRQKRPITQGERTMSDATGQGTFTAVCNDVRASIKETAISAKFLADIVKKGEHASSAVEDRGEMIANLMLTYRHLEDASMRLGKAIQAHDGGVSVYDRTTVVGPDASTLVHDARL
jgi:hypothetical protein